MNGAPSPMHPVAPPTKKQRSSNDAPLRGGGRDALSTAADDAIARRRAELRRLQQMRSVRTGNGSVHTSTQGLLDLARAQLSSSSDGPPPVGSSTGPTTAPSMPPPDHRVARVRHSDIFPHAPKPPIISAPRHAPPPGAPVDPTPRVARRLDSDFGDKTPSQSRSKSAPPSRPPPPPVPVPLAAEAPPTVHRPPPITPGLAQEEFSKSPPTTARRDLLRNLRQLADTPPKEDTDIRLVKELKRAQDDKAHALRKVARLQEQIQQLQRQKDKSVSLPSTADASLETLVQLAEHSGEHAALHWARQQVSGAPTQSFSQVGFLSPLTGAAIPTHGASMTPGRKRVSTPHPKRDNSKSNEAHEFLAEAAKSTPDEYDSMLATYVVRRPYESSLFETDLWVLAGTQSSEAYQLTTDVSKPSTLEVAAKIKADGSILTLSGVSTVRHRNESTHEWKLFEDVDEMDKPLGCVMYIDGDANEKEYWLDAIYEEALATRETYCSSLIATASAFQARKAQGDMHGSRQSVPLQPIEIVKEIERPRPPVSDACVGTEEVQSLASKPTDQIEMKKEPKQESPPPPAPIEEEIASDVLSSLLGMLFTTMFGLIWLVLFRIPFKIVSFTLLVVTTGATLSVIWLYVADDHGASRMGAGMDYGFNRPGIM